LLLELEITMAILRKRSLVRLTLAVAVVLVATSGSVGVADAAAFPPAFVLARPSTSTIMNTRLSVQARGAHGRHRRVSSRVISRIARQSGTYMTNNDDDDNKKDLEEQQLQQEKLNAMMLGGDTSRGVFGLGGGGGKSKSLFESDGSTGNEKEEEVALYNAVPLFTGSIFVLFSMSLTLYGFYVFFTGEDPLLGQPNVHALPDLQ
jgi:hypothetical protein